MVNQSIVYRDLSGKCEINKDKLAFNPTTGGKIVAEGEGGTLWFTGYSFDELAGQVEHIN